jgi:hypothetical protein
VVSNGNALCSPTFGWGRQMWLAPNCEQVTTKKCSLLKPVSCRICFCRNLVKSVHGFLFEAMGWQAHIFSFLGGRTQELEFRNSFPFLSPRLVSLIILLALNLTTSHCNLIALPFAYSIFYTPLKVNASNLIVISTLQRLLPQSVLKYSFG